MLRHSHKIGLVLAGLVSPNALAEIDGYVTLTTDYVFRGVTYSDSGPSAQVGLEWAHDSGAFAGVWASTLDISDDFGQQRDLEVSYYAGYSKPLGDLWTLTGTVVTYRYPDTEGPFDYGFEEVGLTLNFEDRIWVDYAFSPDIYDTGYETHNLEAYTEWQLPLDLTMGAGAGWYDLSMLTKTSGYSYWQAGLSRNFGAIGVDLRYHDTNRSVPFFSSAERADARLVLSARFQF